MTPSREHRLHPFQRLHRQVAQDRVAGGDGAHRRDLDFAEAAGNARFPAAAGLERTARWRRERRGDLALEHDHPLLDLRVRDRNR